MTNSHTRTRGDFRVGNSPNTDVWRKINLRSSGNQTCNLLARTYELHSASRTRFPKRSCAVTTAALFWKSKLLKTTILLRHLINYSSSVPSTNVNSSRTWKHIHPITTWELSHTWAAGLRRQTDAPHVADQPILNLPDRCTHRWRARVGVGGRAKKHWAKCCQDVDALLFIYLLPFPSLFCIRRALDTFARPVIKPSDWDEDKTHKDVREDRRGTSKAVNSASRRADLRRGRVVQWGAEERGSSLFMVAETRGFERRIKRRMNG